MDRLLSPGNLWARHIRVYADLAMTDSTPTGLESIAFGFSDIQNTNFSGRIVTASGNLTNGIKAAGWTATNPTSLADYNDKTKWGSVPEASPPYCFTSSSETAGTCGAAPALFTVATPRFIFNSGGGATTAAAFKTAFAGMTFTTIDLDNELPW